MRLAHFKHSCLLVELNETKILFDPGGFSHGFEGLTGLDAILITHQHPDHIDTERLSALIDANPGAALYADPQTAAQQGDPWVPVHAGNVFQVGNVQVTGGGGRHAIIHPDLPVIDNTVYLLGTPEQPAQLAHPGDSLWVPPNPIDVLAIPAVAPWMKISEAVDYLRAVRPRLAVPIHQEVAAEGARGIYYSRLSEMAPDGTEFRVLEEETATEVA
ncbi:MAG: MBL fold metallo-hydrolase [Aldersonia sp.]|nr:MBL fold metallo-hydrolase [Aldersonia sp.]